MFKNILQLLNELENITRAIEENALFNLLLSLIGR